MKRMPLWSVGKLIFIHNLYEVFHQHLSLAVVTSQEERCQYFDLCADLFDLILAILSVLTSVAAHHLPPFNE